MYAHTRGPGSRERRGFLYGLRAPTQKGSASAKPSPHQPNRLCYRLHRPALFRTRLRHRQSQPHLPRASAPCHSHRCANRHVSPDPDKISSHSASSDRHLSTSGCHSAGSDRYFCTSGRYSARSHGHVSASDRHCQPAYKHGGSADRHRHSPSDGSPSCAHGAARPPHADTRTSDASHPRAD